MAFDNRGFRARVAKGHRATYSDPLVGLAGTRVVVGREDGDFPGWRWCRAPDGRAGWVPECLLSEGASGTVLTENYSAVELSVQPGELLEVERALEGWLWARNARGEWGWVPEGSVLPE